MTAVLLVVALLAGAAYATGYRVNVQTGSVPVPAAAATPDQVVSAYVDAYNHRDFTTMTAIYPARAGAYSRVRAMGRMQDLRIVLSRPAADGWVVEVRVDFTGLTGSDLAYAPGPNGWHYWLKRPDADHRWTIIDQGND